MPLIAPLLHSLHFWLSAKKKNRLSEFFRGEQFKCLENATPPIASPTNLFQRAFPQSNFCGPQTVAAPGKVDSSFALYESTLVSIKHIRSRHQKDLPWVVHCKACSLSVAALSFTCWYLPETVFSWNWNLQTSNQLHSARTDSLPLSVPRWYDPPAFDQALLHESPWKAQRDNFPPVKPAWVRLLFVAIPPGWAQRSCSPQCLAQTARHKNFNLGCLPPPRQADNKWERQNRRN